MVSMAKTFGVALGVDRAALDDHIDSGTVVESALA